jgi:hypothetical protein
VKCIWIQNFNFGNFQKITRARHTIQHNDILIRHINLYDIFIDGYSENLHSVHNFYVIFVDWWDLELENFSELTCNAHQYTCEHPNPRYSKRNDALSFLKVKIHTSHGNFKENLQIGENFSFEKILQLDPSCTKPTYDSRNNSFHNTIF